MQSIDLTKKLTSLRSIYSQDYLLPEQIIYSQEKTTDLPKDYRKTMIAFCNVYKMRLIERNSLSEKAKEIFDKESEQFQTPIGTARNTSNPSNMYVVDFQKSTSEWQFPKINDFEK